MLGLEQVAQQGGLAGAEEAAEDIGDAAEEAKGAAEDAASDAEETVADGTVDLSDIKDSDL